MVGAVEGLSREEVVVEVDRSTVLSRREGDGKADEVGHAKNEVPVVPEQIVTWAVSSNIGS